VISDCRPAWERVLQRFGDVSAEALKPTDIEQWTLQLFKDAQRFIGESPPRDLVRGLQSRAEARQRLNKSDACGEPA
jgi:hypothetical protein